MGSIYSDLGRERRMYRAHKMLKKREEFER